MDKSYVTVNIAGKDFRLSSEEGEEHITRVAEYVNEKLEEVQRAYPNQSTAVCMTLAALNLSEELHKLKESYALLDSRISELREMPKAAPVKRPFESKAATAK